MILDVLTSIIAPVIPAFCASGMLKCIALLLTSTGIMTGEEGAYFLLDFMSDVAFYFLPILIAMSSAKRFKVDQGLAICVAGALLYPSFVSLVNDGGSLTIFGLNVPMYTCLLYTSPLKKFFNTSGNVYKEMQLKDKLASMSEEDQLTLLSAHGMLIKRPILIDGDVVLVGFQEKNYEIESKVYGIYKER